MGTTCWDIFRSVIARPTLIANGDNDRMVPSILSEDLHQCIKGSELIRYPGSGHGGVFPYRERFAPSPPFSSAADCAPTFEGIVWTDSTHAEL